MMASRQLLGAAARGRAVGSVSKGLRCMATATDSPLDRKVSALARTACPAPRRPQ